MSDSIKAPLAADTQAHTQPDPKPDTGGDTQADSGGPGEDQRPDPEVAGLLTFDPVPRRFKRHDGWTPALQRKFIALLARTGSPTAAAEAARERHLEVADLGGVE